MRAEDAADRPRISKDSDTGKVFESFCSCMSRRTVDCAKDCLRGHPGRRIHRYEPEAEFVMKISPKSPVFREDSTNNIKYIQ